MLIVSFDHGSQSVSMEREEFLKLVKKEVKSDLHCLLDSLSYFLLNKIYITGRSIQQHGRERWHRR